MLWPTWRQLLNTHSSIHIDPTEQDESSDSDFEEFEHIAKRRKVKVKKPGRPGMWLKSLFFSPALVN